MIHTYTVVRALSCARSCTVYLCILAESCAAMSSVQSLLPGAI